MLKKASLFLLLFVFSCATLAWSEDADSIDYVETDTTYLEEEQLPLLLEEQTQRVFIKDSVDGKALDSVTWKKLTKDLSYKDSLDKAPEADTTTNSEPFDFSGLSINSTVTKYILFALVIAAVLYVLYRLMGSAIFTSNLNIKKTEASLEMLHDDEQMMQQDLSGMLAEALQQKEYKTVIRILFIQSLQELQTQGWINWKKEKTNRDYLNELLPKNAFIPFSSMIMLYEKAWYSEFMATEEDFEAFTNFKQQLKSA
jgi:hypothetical protein